MAFVAFAAPVAFVAFGALAGADTPIRIRRMTLMPKPIGGKFQPWWGSATAGINVLPNRRANKPAMK